MANRDHCALCRRQATGAFIDVSYCDEHETWVEETIREVADLIDWKPLKRILKSRLGGSVHYEVKAS